MLFAQAKGNASYGRAREAAYSCIRRILEGKMRSCASRKFAGDGMQSMAAILPRSRKTAIQVPKSSQ
jgi:hypothetical protein